MWLVPGTCWPANSRWANTFQGLDLKDKSLYIDSCILPSPSPATGGSLASSYSLRTPTPQSP